MSQIPYILAAIDAVRLLIDKDKLHCKVPELSYVII